MKILKKEWIPALYIHYEKEIGQINLRIDKRHDYFETNLEIAEAEILARALLETINEAKKNISEE